MKPILRRFMPMFHLPRVLVSTIPFLVSGAFVLLDGAPVSLSSADGAWSSLKALGASAGGEEAATAAPSDAAQATHLQSEAAAARAFYTAYAADARSAAARKLEALCYLQMSAVGAPEAKAAALAQANSYRHDATVPVQDRFDLAWAIESHMSASKPGALSPPTAASQVALADSLHAEFGEQEPVYQSYTSLMLSSDQPTSLGVAQKILGFSPPAWAKSIAQAVVARSQLLGKPLKLVVTQYGGRPLDLSQPMNVPRIIYFWSNRLGVADLDAIAAYKATIGFRSQIVYACLQADLGGVSEARAKAPLPGAFCFEQSGLQGAAEKYLGLTQLPFVYVLDRKANLVGYGSLDALPALLRQAAN